jgi:imidazolonepropionase-like amidohydrolase
MSVKKRKALTVSWMDAQVSAMPPTLFVNAAVLDAEHATLIADQSVLVEDERIARVGLAETHDDAQVIDVRGKTLMPGLIDCHVHVAAPTANLTQLTEWSPFYVAAHAAAILAGMLRRGFTTVRDAGGADFGLARAVEERLLIGPRILFAGHAISQTGGHGDMRSAGQTALERGYPYVGISAVCDGESAIRQAVREEIKRGATHIKLMLSGGVASPTDRIDSTQFSTDEIHAAVDEADAANLYVMGHAYTSRAINRALECGVRTIEHGNLMDASSPPLFIEHKAFYVPTLVTYSAMVEHGREFGLPDESYRKVFDVLDAGLHALEMADRAGVSIALGTDLLGGLHQFQSREFEIRARVQSAADILRSATLVGARLLRREGQLGVIATGAYADLLVVDGNPLENVALLAQPERCVQLVMKGGRIYHDSLTDH